MSGVQLGEEKKTVSEGQKQGREFVGKLKSQLFERYPESREMLISLWEASWQACCRYHHINENIPFK